MKFVSYQPFLPHTFSPYVSTFYKFHRRAHVKAREKKRERKGCCNAYITFLLLIGLRGRRLFFRDSCQKLSNSGFFMHATTTTATNTPCTKMYIHLQHFDIYFFKKKSFKFFSVFGKFMKGKLHVVERNEAVRVYHRGSQEKENKAKEKRRRDSFLHLYSGPGLPPPFSLHSAISFFPSCLSHFPPNLLSASIFAACPFLSPLMLFFAPKRLFAAMFKRNTFVHHSFSYSYPEQKVPEKSFLCGNFAATYKNSLQKWWFMKCLLCLKF